MAKIAFDIDNTLYKVVYRKYNEDMIPDHQEPDYDIFFILIALKNLGNEIFIWSGGGVDYACAFCNKFGITNISVIPKTKEMAIIHQIDITFDDEEITLGKVNIRIPREKYGDNENYLEI